MAYDQARARPLRAFSPHTVHLGHARIDAEAPPAWAPTVVRRAFPSREAGEAVAWAPVPQALLAAVAVPLTTNFGCAGCWGALFGV